MLKTYIAVMLGGCLGVAARVWLSFAIASKWGETFPLGTLVVNVTGCFLIGAFKSFTWLLLFRKFLINTVFMHFPRDLQVFVDGLFLLCKWVYSFRKRLFSPVG